MRSPAKRITLVLPDLRMGGGQRVLLQLAREFVDAGRTVEIVCLTSDGALAKEVPAGVLVHYVTKHGGGARMATTALPRLVQYFRGARPDAVLSTMTGTNLLVAIALGLARSRSRLVLREAVGSDNDGSRLRRLLIRHVYPLSRRVVAVSAGVADDLMQLGLGAKLVRVIYNPIDVKRLRDLGADGHIPSEVQSRPYVLSIGRLVEQKDHCTLLRAFALSELRHRYRLVIVGEGAQRRELEALASELGIADQMVMPGAMANPYGVLAGASLHVLSSRWEGYPNVLLEALALGVPVVSTDCPHGPRELLEGGRHGSLVPVGDFAALARAMDAALTLPSPRADEVLSRNDPRVIASRYLSLLDGDAEVRAS